MITFIHISLGQTQNAKGQTCIRSQRGCFILSIEKKQTWFLSFWVLHQWHLWWTWILQLIEDGYALLHSFWVNFLAYKRFSKFWNPWRSPPMSLSYFHLSTIFDSMKLTYGSPVCHTCQWLWYLCQAWIIVFWEKPRQFLQCIFWKYSQCCFWNFSHPFSRLYEGNHIVE